MLFEDRKARAAAGYVIRRSAELGAPVLCFIDGERIGTIDAGCQRAERMLAEKPDACVGVFDQWADRHDLERDILAALHV
jgi:hypothetical protein